MRVSSSRRMSLKCNVRHEVPYPQVHENRFLFFKLCLRPVFSLGFLIFFCLLHSSFHNRLSACSASGVRSTCTRSVQTATATTVTLGLPVFPLCHPD